MISTKVLLVAILCTVHPSFAADVTSSAPPTSTNGTTSLSPPTTISTTTMPPTTKLTTSTSTTPTTSMTTMAPTTPAPHKDYMWTVKDPKTGKICIMADMKIQLDIPYTNSSDGKIVMTHVKVPGNATGSGSCSIDNPSMNQTLTLQWGGVNSTSMLTLTFSANSTNKQFWLGSIMAVVSVDNKTFPHISPTVKQVKMLNDTMRFMTPMDNSYDCSSLVNVPAFSVTPYVNQTAYFTFEKFQLEAFKNTTGNGFSQPIYCEGDNTPDLVPILVGCTLVGLVVIVLGVYLWGRRRSQQRGYHSM